ncbi:uncharacterized protein [Pseudorasbora parva]|uniref:uncharacterized protein n=1 Tax=Pseudorasbora parva TaxID=51549 RepID=UPI00351DB0AA
MSPDKSTASSSSERIGRSSAQMTPPGSFEEDNFSSRMQWIMKREFLLDQLAELQSRSQERREESQSMMERFKDIHKSLEYEMENVEKSRVTMEQLEGLQKSFEDFQAHVHHNVGRLQNNFQKMQERVKSQGKSRKEDLNPSLVQDILSLKCCPTVPEMKANPNALSEYSSNLIGVLNNIARSDTCSPATSWALKITTETIGNLSQAFQDHCKEAQGVRAHPRKQKKVAEEVNRKSNVSLHQQVQKPKTDAVSKRLTLPQVKESRVQKAKIKGLEKTPKDLQSQSADSLAKVCRDSKEEMRKVTSFNKMTEDEVSLGSHRPTSQVKFFEQIPEEEAKAHLLRAGTSFQEVAQEDLQSPSTHNIHRPSPVKSFELPQITEEETKGYLDSMLRAGTSFEEVAQKNLQSPSTRNIHRPSPVKSFELPQIPKGQAKVYVDSMLRAGTSFEEVAQKDLPSPSTCNIHRPSHVKSFELPQIPEEESKTYVDSMLRAGTSFEEVAQKDRPSPSTRNIHHPSPVKSFELPQIPLSVKGTKLDMVPVEDLQSPSPAPSHLSSIMKRPQIQKPSLQTPDNPKKNKYVSTVSDNSKEDDDQLLHDQTLVIDIKAQEYNLKLLDQSFENDKISSETYNQCKGNISQALQSVDLRLGCLFQRYIRHVKLKQLGKKLNENFKVTRDLKDGWEFKKVHSQLCKFDHFQKTVRKIWDAKQASRDETRRWCISRMANLYHQVNSTHGLHLTGISCVQRHVPLSLLTVTPVRFGAHLHLSSPPPRPPTVPRASPARLLRNNRKVLHSTDASTVYRAFA